MKGSGQENKGQGLELKHGLMEQNMKGIGKIIRPKEKANLFILLATFITEIGKMIKLMGMEFIRIIKAKQSIKESGLMIYSMAEEYRVILMEINTKGNLSREGGMEWVNILFLMEGYMKEIGKMERCKEKEYLVGLMVEDTMENGRITKSMDREFSSGKKEKCIRVNLEMIKKMGMESISGEMENSILENSNKI